MARSLQSIEGLGNVYHRQKAYTVDTLYVDTDLRSQYIRNENTEAFNIQHVLSHINITSIMSPNPPYAVPSCIHFWIHMHHTPFASTVLT